MNKIPPANETLALLDKLRQTVHDFAMREEKLTSDFHNRSVAAQNQNEAQTEKMESDWEERLAAAEADLQAARKNAVAVTENRKLWIEEAYKHLRNRASSNVETRDAQWREQVQKGLAEAEQQRDAELATAASANQSFHQKLAEAGQTFHDLEKRARRAFHVSGKFRRLIRRQPAPEEAPFDGDEFFARLEKLRDQIEKGLGEFQKATGPRLLQFVPIWPLAILLLLVAIAEPILWHFHSHVIPDDVEWVDLGAFLFLVIVTFLAARTAGPAAGTIGGYFVKVHGMLNGASEKIEAHYQQEQQRIQGEFEANETALNKHWKEGARNIARLGTSLPM